jgi:hypothetical protein
MKIKKPSESTVKGTVAMAGGAFAGSIASNLAFGAIHKPGTPADAAAIKKEENTVMMKRGLLVLAGLGLTMFVDGKDAVADLVRGTGIGMALNQGNEIIKTVYVRNGGETEAVATTAAKKLAARAVGLGCSACTGNYPLNGRGLRYSDAPSYDWSMMDRSADPVAGDFNGLVSQKLMS